MTIDIKDNSLNFIRMFAALQVLVLHANTHMSLGMGVTKDILGLLPGVPIFFCISGFLISYSLRNSHSMKEYFEKRIMRIYPELWGGVIVSSIFIFLFYEQVINIGQFIVFNITQATFMQFYTPSFLREYGVGTPNGSLWTITVTVQFYIIFYFAHSFLKKQKMSKWIGIIVVFLMINIATLNLDLYIPSVLYKLYLQTVIPYLYMFLIGSFIFTFRNRLIPILKKYFYLLLTLLIIVSYFNIGLNGVYINSLKGVILCLLTISFAYKFNIIKVKLDLSYGIFIYHMIIINVFVHLGVEGNVLSLLIVILLSVIFAYVSNKMVMIFRYKKANKLRISSQ